MIKKTPVLAGYKKLYSAKTPFIQVLSFPEIFFLNKKHGYQSNKTCINNTF